MELFGWKFDVKYKFLVVNVLFIDYWYEVISISIEIKNKYGDS